MLTHWPLAGALASFESAHVFTATFICAERAVLAVLRLRTSNGRRAFTRVASRRP
jgi:hypothetical protein